MSVITVTLREDDTDHFLGRCTPCELPLRVTVPGRDGNEITLDCPQCRKPFTINRLRRTTSADYCDSACMSAYRPGCECSCDGENHGAAWHGGPRRYNTETCLFDEVDPTPEYLAALDKHRTKTAARAERTERRRAEKAAAKKAAAEAAYAAWLKDLNTDQAHVVDWLANRFNTVEAADFVHEMGCRVRVGDPLSPRQLDAVVNWIMRDWQWAADAATEAMTAKPFPTGRRTVTGKIVSTHVKDKPYGGGHDYKMIVRSDDGWRAWMTIPESLFVAVDYRMGQLRHRRVEVTVTLKPSDDDPLFGKGVNPKGARLLDAA